MKKHILYLVLLILAGCIKGPTLPVYEPEPNVGCLLSPDYKRQEVRVGKSWRIDEVDPQMWVSGADVKISCAADTVTFHELSGRPGVYVSESLLVESGNTYFLEVDYPDGNKVTGRTKVPQKPRIITPADGDTVSPSHELRWESEGVAGFLLQYYYYEYGGGGANMLPEDLGHATSITVDSLCIKYFGCHPDSLIRFTLRIWSADTNYYDYYRIKEYDEPMETNMHLEGGLGVFGSFVVSDSISVVIKHQ